MKTGILLIGIVIWLSVLSFAAEPTVTYWPTWRGPLNTGESPDGNPPLEWNESKNIRWAVPIEGKGLSSPIVYQDHIFLTTAVDMEKEVSKEVQKSTKKHPMWMRASGQNKNAEHYQRFVVLAYSRKDGTRLWEKVINEQFPHEGIHKDGSWASNSCVTDGVKLYAYFGSYGLYCMNFDGEIIWQKDLGDMSTSNSFGEGSSPAIYGDYLIINWDHEEGSFITALNKSTGEPLWKTDRDEITSWSTPLIVEVNGKPQIITSATNKSRAYDLKTGELLWELAGMTSNVIPSPVHADGIVYLISGFRGNALQAVELAKARGNIDNTPAVRWTLDKDTPYVPSPLLYNGRLYFFRGNNEQVTCVDAASGKVFYNKEKLDEIDGVYASPVGASNRIYVAGRNGVTYVLQDGPELNVLAVNSLPDRFDASPAVAGQDLYLRGLEKLYCISQD